MERTEEAVAALSADGTVPMAFDREIVEQVVAACQVGLGEASQACARGLDVAAQLSVVSSGPFEMDSLPAECSGPGLLFVLKVEGVAALVAVPETTGLVPAWSLQPDATGKSKLATLAVEWGMLLLPEAYSAMDGTAGYVRDLAGALRRAGLGNAGRVSLQASAGDRSGLLTLVWPAAQAEAALQEPALQEPAVAETEPVAAAPNVAPVIPPANPAATGDVLPGSPVSENTTAPVPPEPVAPPPRMEDLPPIPPSPPAPPEPPPRRQIRYEELEEGIAQLPAYSRSLLRIKVPVTVTLAESRQPLNKVLDIGPGSIIHFNKPCEDTLTLEVAGQRVAVGEAVKVGDKFGLWITSMIMPDERFWVISDRAVPERAK